jgi:hypothetical protein
MIKYLLIANIILLIFYKSKCEILTLSLKDKIKGEVTSETFSHYQLNHQGNYKLELISLNGDADLYITDKHYRADYLNYDSQSTTCGVDELFISENMKRPVAIGIYGHPNYIKSGFVLNIYSYAVKDHFKIFDSDEKSFDHGSTYEKHHENNNNINNEKKIKQKETDDYVTDQDDGDYEPTSPLWALFIKILEIIAEILL